MSTISTGCPRRNQRRIPARVPRKTPVDLTSLPPPPPTPERTVAAAAEGLISLSSPAVGSGASATAIDVEAIEDEDVQLLPSPRGFPQRRNQLRRRNRPVVVVVDDERESHSQRAVHAVHSSRLDRSLKRPKLIIVDCESSSMTEGASVPEPRKQPVPKEPSYCCPICLNPIKNLCSTTCGHIFCESCVDTAVRVQKKCPTCRKKLTNKGFHRVFLTGTIND